MWPSDATSQHHRPEQPASPSVQASAGAGKATVTTTLNSPCGCCWPNVVPCRRLLTGPRPPEVRLKSASAHLTEEGRSLETREGGTQDSPAAKCPLVELLGLSVSSVLGPDLLLKCFPACSASFYRLLDKNIFCSRSRALFLARVYMPPIFFSACFLLGPSSWHHSLSVSSASEWTGLHPCPVSPCTAGTWE